MARRSRHRYGILVLAVSCTAATVHLLMPFFSSIYMMYLAGQERYRAITAAFVSCSVSDLVVRL